MAHINRILAQLAAAEDALWETTFLAPCSRGGRVRVRVAGILHTFRPDPADFEGWGLFRPGDAKTARLVETADLPLIDAYLKRLAPIRFLLAHPLSGQAWLGYPANESDAVRRLGAARPVPVRLVGEGAAFETVRARWDGAALWFEETDRRADPSLSDRLRAALREMVMPEGLRIAGLTPEMRAAYDVAAQRAASFSAAWAQRRAEGRLSGALRMAGGELRDFRERGDVWQVEWTTRDGARHVSAIAKNDLTVVSSGICLSGRDRDFDLSALVGVMERAEEFEDW